MRKAIADFTKRMHNFTIPVIEGRISNFCLCATFRSVFHHKRQLKKHEHPNTCSGCDLPYTTRVAPMAYKRKYIYPLLHYLKARILCVEFSLRNTKLPDFRLYIFDLLFSHMIQILRCWLRLVGLFFDQHVPNNHCQFSGSGNYSGRSAFFITDTFKKIR